MKELGFHPKKFLGQNFLISSVVIEKTLSAVADLKPSLIVEVGPGLGALTEGLFLLKKPLFLVEKDLSLCRYWHNRLKAPPHLKQATGHARLKVPPKPLGFVLKGDVLKLSWHARLLPGSVLTGNLPYNIAGRLLLKSCPGPPQLKAMVLMFQKEVAQRILARPGSKNYGILSVLSQCFWRPRLLLQAGTSDFYPRPKVAGRVLIFEKKKHSVSDPKNFLLFVKFCFSQRRKILLSRLQAPSFPHGSRKLKSQRETESHLCDFQGFSVPRKRESKQNIKKIFNKLKISPTARPEEFSPSQFISLFQEL